MNIQANEATYWRSLAGAAATIDERIYGNVVEPIGNPSATHQRLYQQWAKVHRLTAIPGDHSRCIDKTNWLRYFGDVIWNESSPLPEWITAIACIHEKCRELLQGNAEIEWERALTYLCECVVAVVRERCQGYCTLPNIQLSDSVARELDDNLRQRVAALCRPVFVDYAVALKGLFSRTLNPISGGCLFLFQEYPVLARVIGTMAGQEARKRVDLLTRLNDDLPDIQAAGLLAATARKVHAIDFLAGDQHCGGSTTALLEFDNGQRLVYRPRSVNADLAWNRLVRWLQESIADVHLYARNIVARGGYGWLEYVYSKPIASSPSRSFALLGCAAQLAGLRDLHADNVISTDLGLTVIDAETIAHPVIESRSRVGPAGAIGNTAWEAATSIVSTGLFNPSAGVDSYGSLRNLGLPDPVAVPGAMIGNPVVEKEMVHELQRWFVRIRTLLRGDDLERAIQILATVECTRVMIRSSADYDVLRILSRKPEALRSGVGWSLHFYALPSLKHVAVDGELQNAIGQAERAALARGDIPCFEWHNRSKRLLESKFFIGVISEWRSPSIIRISTATLQRQVSMAAVSFRHANSYIRRCSPLERQSGNRQPTKWSETTALERATRIGVSLLAYSDCRRGSRSWIMGLTNNSEHSLVFGECGLDLYYGNAGIALVLAALYKLTGDRIFFKGLGTTLSPVLKAVQDPYEGVKAFGFGGLHGLPSMILAVACIGQVLQDGHLLDLANGACRSLGSMEDPHEIPLELATGLSGYVLAMGGSCASVGTNAAFCMRNAARQLLRHLRHQSCGLTPDTSMAHGNCGLVAALAAALASAPLNDHDAIAARDLILKFMHSRAVAGELMDNSWCKGRLGLLATEVLCNKVALSFRSRTELQRDLVSHLNMCDCARVCCGTLGHVDLLITSGQMNAASEILHRLTLGWEDCICDSTYDDQFAPSLYCGIAGAAYQLLRFVSPTLLPSLTTLGN